MINFTRRQCGTGWRLNRGVTTGSQQPVQINSGSDRRRDDPDRCMMAFALCPTPRPQRTTRGTFPCRSKIGWHNFVARRRRTGDQVSIAMFSSPGHGPLSPLIVGGDPRTWHFGSTGPRRGFMLPPGSMERDCSVVLSVDLLSSGASAEKRWICGFRGFP